VFSGDCLLVLGVLAGAQRAGLDPAIVWFDAHGDAAHGDILRSLPDGPLVVHVDLDVVDPGDLAGLLFPAPDGPSATAVLDAVRQLVETGRVAVLDFACPWHPAVDDEQTATRVALLAAVIRLVEATPER